ncbi:ACT domain-containing protein [Bacillota bacterium Meth-B3]|nr:ACT domain-containing protein [Christensenellaceae bacterium]MEA5067129.1 ACT domain-containing protein [Eubacteriales bacterium]MEA5067946.1 ACT domain-containing protein [Christensenellaceae bacterium]
MYVKQISVFLENSKGTLARMTRLLGEAGLDLIALSIADTEHYGILRCIVTDAAKAIAVLKEAGYTARLTDVLAVCVDDRPGGLADVLDALSSEAISVEYLYSFVRTTGNYALVIFHLSDIARGRELLLEKGVRLLDQDELRAL